MSFFRKKEKVMPYYDVGLNIYNGAIKEQVKTRLAPNGRKRILSLDGGGIRGAITLGILEHLEEHLGNFWQAKGKNKNEFRLWHYFDFIIGTSTGAIIATLLAAGLSVKDIKNLYQGFASTAFKQQRKGKNLVKGTYRRQPLLDLLENEFARIPNWPKTKHAPLSRCPLRTGWGIVTRCLDSDHTWFVHNNDTAKYYKENCVIPLSQLVRSSTAAAPYFNPELVKLAGRDRALADGGLSAFNNPALAALVLATLKEKVKRSGPLFRGFRWDLGSDKILLVSVGTGWLKESRKPTTLVHGKWPILLRLKDPIIRAFMGDANFLSQGMLLWMSESLTPRPVHGVAEDFSGEYLHPGARKQHFLTYLRYDVDLHDPGSYPVSIFKPKPGVSVSRRAEEALKLGRKFDNFTTASNVKKLLEIGDHRGQRIVKAVHFPSTFIPSFW